MTFDQEMTILLIGAGIGLFSSLVATIVNHLLQKRVNDAQKKEKVLHLFGELAAKRIGQGHIEWEEFLNDSKSLKEKIVKSIDSSDDADLLIGLIQGIIDDEKVSESVKK
ncbi:MAG: hypothetical protein H6667_19800 [Ardenticatenaceae bacterium]|nr:hypothetical protein [Ardenticatenaceae bacterium]